MFRSFHDYQYDGDVNHPDYVGYEFDVMLQMMIVMKPECYC